MRPIYFALAFLVASIATAAIAPCHALVKQGQALYANGAFVGTGQDQGPWRLVPFNWQAGIQYTSRPAPANATEAAAPSTNPLDMSLVVDGVVTRFVKDSTVTKANIWRAGTATLQAFYYQGATRYRLRYRVKPGSSINTAEVKIAGIYGYGQQYNLDRGGAWDGRAAGRLGTTIGPYAYAYVENAKEKYPRGYRFDSTGLYLAFHTNQAAKDVSKAGIKDLRAYLTGTLTTKMPPEYVSMLQNDPDINQAAQEVQALDQAQQLAEFYIGMDFWLASDSVNPAPPLVFLDGYESPVWSKPKQAPSVADLKMVEDKIVNDHKNWLAGGARGSLLYGNFSEQPTSYYRWLNMDHYFHCITTWRAYLRTGRADMYNMARVFNNYNRDTGYLDGSHTHAKGLVPWVGPWTVNGHWCDTEALLFSWLCDADYLSLEEYQTWAKIITDGYPQPTRNDREATVFKRMADVAFWYTKDGRWQVWAKIIEDRFFANLEKVKATPDYQTYAYGLPTGTQFHPLWTNRPMALKTDVPEGVLNCSDLIAAQRLETMSPIISYGVWPIYGEGVGPGLLGEGYVGLQMERIYEYYRGKRFKPERRIIYGTQWNGVQLNIEKNDSDDSELRVAVATRMHGDTPPIIVDITNPSGKTEYLLDYRTDPSVRFPVYALMQDGGSMGTPTSTTLGGWQVYETKVPFKGGPGRYSILVHGFEGILLHGPMSKYSEWQDLTTPSKYPGQGADGTWPTDGVFIGN